MAKPVSGAEGVLEQARRVSAQAATAAGVRVREPDSLDELRAASNLFDSTWTSDGGSYMPLSLLRALAHAGNYVSAAFVDGELAGALVAFLGFHRGEPSLHSHMLAVSPDMRGRNIGVAMKLHQRTWAWEREIRLITWTFDPLVSRNSYLNLTQLGAHAAEYLPNFYGEMSDSVNPADESDRILAEWRLDDDRAMAATGGLRHDATHFVEAHTLSCAMRVGDMNRPVLQTVTADELLCCVPRDIDAIRRSDAALAREWRLGLRQVLGTALATGYVVEAFLRSGCYVLIRGSILHDES
ncbi:MAG: GNAT family N-acetyltransferase [Actinomycetota bacterium]|nr:GNAT family N-acetyltransferase [Actinomycetota bacterium]